MISSKILSFLCKFLYLNTQLFCYGAYLFKDKCYLIPNMKGSDETCKTSFLKFYYLIAKGPFKYIVTLGGAGGEYPKKSHCVTKGGGGVMDFVTPSRLMG